MKEKMKEVRDPAIKLFGKEIALPEKDRIPSVSGGYCGDDRNSATSACLEAKKMTRTGDEEQRKEEMELEADHKDSPAGKQGSPPEPVNREPLPVPVPVPIDNPKTPPIDEENASAKPPDSENDQSDTNNQQQKPLKKPDKILPCPRCNSMDTKFCYYNNYNVNQPRHFCRGCQRYWTAGGTMRNVPVGAGRRKNKNSTSHFRHVTIPEALRGIRIDAPNGFHHQYPASKPNGTVLSFGPEVPLCESIASVLKLAEKTAPPPNGGENIDDCSSGSSVTTTNSVAEGRGRNGIQEPMMQPINGFSSQIPCLPGIPFPYPWNSAVPLPAFCPPGFPMPFYPAPYWNCGVPGAWSVPFFPAPDSSTLGKHSRDGELLKPSNPERKESEPEKNPEGSVLIPKTLRIDDPDEAARSSIWATLGIKNDSPSRGSLFKAFQPKGVKKNHSPETPPSLWANPAALSRSLGFQESA